MPARRIDANPTMPTLPVDAREAADGRELVDECVGDTIDSKRAMKKKPSLYKTELCRSFEETGACRYGAKCQFAHSLGELRGIDRHPKYKTELCKTFWEKGSCPYGKRCCFVHSDNAALHAPSPSTSPASPAADLRASPVEPVRTAKIPTASSWKPLTPSPQIAAVSSPFSYPHESLDALDFTFKSLALGEDALVDPAFVRRARNSGHDGSVSMPFFYDPPLNYARFPAGHQRAETLPSAFSPPTSAVSSPFTPPADFSRSSPYLGAASPFLFPQVRLSVF
jgi:hypothetical protein